MTADSGPRFDFPTTARGAFDFLQSGPYSLILAREDDNVVTYRGNGVAVAISQDPLSYELDLQVSRVARPEEVKRPYCLQDLIRATDESAADAYTTFAATSAEAVQRGMFQLSQQVRQYAEPALRGSDEFFDLVSRKRAATVRRFGRRLTDTDARRQAEKAWTERDYAAAASAYESIGDLTRAEQQRLTIARLRATRAV